MKNVLIVLIVAALFVMAMSVLEPNVIYLPILFGGDEYRPTDAPTEPALPTYAPTEPEPTWTPLGSDYNTCLTIKPGEDPMWYYCCKQFGLACYGG